MKKWKRKRREKTLGYLNIKFCLHIYFSILFVVHIFFVFSIFYAYSGTTFFPSYFWYLLFFFCFKEMTFFFILSKSYLFQIFFSLFFFSTIKCEFQVLQIVSFLVVLSKMEKCFVIEVFVWWSCEIISVYFREVDDIAITVY